MTAHHRVAVAAAAVTGLCAAVSAQTVYAVTDNQRLVSFSASTPSTLLSGVAISGLMSNETVLGIDFRPATGELYALGSFSNLYTIDIFTGAATAVGAGFATPLNGSSFGFDFNPTIDRIRVVGDADQNLVLNPDTGSATVVTPLFYAAGDANAGFNPNVVGSAYTNSVANATSTQLYGIDTGLDVLVTQANSAGTLQTVGSLGADLTDLLGFDIDGVTNLAYAATFNAADARTTFWAIDLLTGGASAIGEVGGGARLTSIAVAPDNVVPAPASAALLGLFAAANARRRR